jgi:hypothetical protein
LFEAEHQIEKAPWGAFSTSEKPGKLPLFALSSLMPCAGQQLTVFVLSHFFSTLFDNTSQKITSFHLIF